MTIPLQRTFDSPLVFLDDDEEFLRSVCIESFPIRTTSSSDEALGMAREGSALAVVSDLRMAPVDGVVLLERVRSLNPHIPLYLWTGFEPDSIEHHRLAAAGVTVISKTSATAHDELVADIFVDALRRRAELSVDERARLKRLEAFHSAFANDLVESLMQIRDRGSARVWDSKGGFTVNELIQDIRALTPRGLEHIALWRRFLGRLARTGTEGR